MQHAIVVFYTLITSAFLSPVLWGWWNYAVVKFIPAAPQVTLWDAAIFLIGVQIIPFFLVRRMAVQYVPLSVPQRATDEEAK